MEEKIFSQRNKEEKGEEACFLVLQQIFDPFQRSWTIN